MPNDKADPRRRARGALGDPFRLVTPLFLFLACVLAQGCTCSSAPKGVAGVITCLSRQPVLAKPGAMSGVPTVPAGTIPGTFSVTASGEASYVLPLTVVPGRAGVEPRLAVTYDGSGDGVLGAGFSLSGLSAITRCSSNLAQDGEVRGVSYDGKDQLCLDGKRLVAVSQDSGTIEYRTFPDTNTKVIGHQPDGSSAPADATSFEAITPTGLVVEYGGDPSGVPLTPSGAAQAWLATKVRDPRGNAMTMAYCFAEADGYTAEVAIDSIRYTSFEGMPALPASRAVTFVYDTKDPADVRTRYAGGMALQSSLRLREVEMLGEGDELVRRYAFTYGLGPTTNRTLLTSMEECGSDSVCKPPTQFQYTSSAAGFQQQATTLLAPTATRASPMLTDVDGDGLDDLVVPDTVPGLSTPGNPITHWNVALNKGTAPGFFGASTVALTEDWPMVPNPSGSSDPTQLQPELGTAIEWNADGLTGVFLHDVYNTSPNWIVLVAQPDHTFKQHDTGIPRPFPRAGLPEPPNLTTSGASIHFADVDGDGIPDLISCLDHSESNVPGTDPSRPTWTAQLWKPANGSTPAGFDPVGERIRPLDGYPCDGEMYTSDLNADGKVDLIQGVGGTDMIQYVTYEWITRLANGTWVPNDTGLLILPAGAGGRLVFLDLNGDGLPDAVESGQQDRRLYTWINHGADPASGVLFALDGAPSLPDLTTAILPGVGVTQDAFFGYALPLDYNADGLQDLLLPMPGGAVPGKSDGLPAWAILQSTGTGTFTIVDPHIPFDATLTAGGIGLADPHAPRAGDLNGDGAEDVILPLGGVFNAFTNLAADQDLLLSISDGMNAHDATDPGFLPNVSLTYGHLSDASITNGIAAGDPSLESLPYLSHADPNNGCTYPRACAVGSHRVVTGYVTNNGADVPRHFAVRYRDGRYHRLGRGFLGFGERVVVDLDTQAGVATSYDNVTEQDLGTLPVFPYAGQAQREARWFPGLATQPDPSQFEVTLTDVTPSFVPTNSGATYLTRMAARRVRKAEGTFPSAAAPTAEAYVQQIAAGTAGTVLLDATTTISKRDPFGYPQIEDITAAGVDLTVHVERTYHEDSTRWILGQLATQKECSAAAGLSRCRTLTRNTTQYGEVHDDTLDSDEGIPDTRLTVTIDRYPTGNVLSVTASDAFGHQRASSVQYDSDDIYPTTLTNALSQSTTTKFDPDFGVLTSMVDPNKLPTTRQYDRLGRLVLEKRPDGSQTTITLARTKDGGPQGNAWRVTKETTTTGGADDTVEYDSLSREVRWWWHGPDTGGVARVMQEIVYDALGEHVARRSVPDSGSTPEAQLLNDLYQYDALGREVLHTTPWGPALPTSYSGLKVTATDALMNATVTVLDPLGRTVTVTDAAGSPTVYVYGPFGQLYTVTAPGNALTRTTRDAYGRVRQLDDPNRGTTTSIHDGFGELMSSTDALGRVVSYEYDALGRTLSRVDQNGAEMLTTSWAWDSAPHGIGKLASLVGPDGTKSYGYTPASQLQTLTLDVDVTNGVPERLVGSLTYDSVGRVQTITYPASAGGSFAVDQQYDAYGHVLSVQDDATKKPYWQLTAVDGAGRSKTEGFGNGATTTRAYFPDKQRLQSITTTSGTTSVQSLTYSYDARLDLQSRSDALQTQNTTEWFRYDPVERLTCAYFSVVQNDAAPCVLGYGYDPSGNGNLTSKSDVGTLAYGDPAHPHAVTSAGSDAFGYDAVGNQTSRPGATIAYTPFDLPRTITQGSGAVTFAYDGDEQRIRKTTPTEETLYFGDLYQRDTVTGMPAAHRYYVHSPERVVAVVTVGGTAPGTLYVHVDHLGSVDVLTNESGTPVEKRSYDPFGQRRNPVWGQPPPATFPNLTTVAFTGQEADNELGLVNMKGRIFDPRVGRFLTTDPVVSDPLSAQRWNAYSYVLNNPLSFIDPTGFDEVLVQIPSAAPPPPPQPATAEEEKEKQTKGKDVDISQALAAGAARLPTDVDTNGGGRTAPPQPTATIAAAVKGFATGVYWFYTPNPLPYLKAVTGITLADNAVKGAREDGAVGAFAGAVNTINPLYHWGVGVMDTQQKAAAGDTAGAVEAGTGVVLGIATTGFGLALGATGQRAPATPSYPEGSFSIVDWTGYPEGIPKPSGPFRLLAGEEYASARAAADEANQIIRMETPGLQGSGMHIHEIHPVKFGGSPTDVANKMLLPAAEHVGPNGVHPQFWTRLQQYLESRSF